ncbi:MAG: 1,6-anhydro-N-acetylmuramyl-L-alanine amidase AmpD [Gammaproteobacteria bacterium]|nr:MAG: 1,6-anhydro-N-acetylmuramyl-L-alanine amidase AmpD [Gammaproteobacteria bacterium]
MINSCDDDLLPGVPFLRSPNCNNRPAGTEIDLIVLHGISVPAGRFGGRAIHELFMNTLDCSALSLLSSLQGLQVSAHLLIDRAGEVTQFVPFEQRAWHAGESVWTEREACNDYSIGIELEGVDQCAYTPRQYQRLVAVVVDLMQRYPRISPARVVGHCDVAPGRKTDPGPVFNWAGFRRQIERFQATCTGIS